MFSDARVGDAVWSFRYGWGSIKKILVREKEEFGPKAIVEFITGIEQTYYGDGIHPGERNRDLFWDEIKYEIPSRPRRKRKVWIILLYSENGNSIFSFNEGTYGMRTFDTKETAKKWLSDQGALPRRASFSEIEIEE